MTVTPNDQLHPNWKKASVVPLQVTGSHNGDNSMEIISTGTSDEDLQLKSKFTISIKTCSIGIFLIVIFLCVLFLTAIWVAFFADTTRSMAKSLTEAQFTKITQYTETTFREIAVASDTIKYQIITAMSSNHSDIHQPKVMKHMQNTYFNEIKYHAGFVNAASLYGRGVPHQGILMVKTLPVSQTLQNETGLYRYPCVTLNVDQGCIPANYSYSVKTTKPYDTTSSYSVIKKNPGRPVYTLTFKTPGIDAVLIALVNSYTAPTNLTKSTPDKPFDWFLHLDMSVDNMSKFLKSTTADYVIGSLGLIVESSTNYIIATSKPEISITGRIPPENHQDLELRSMYSELVSSYPNPLNVTLKCNSIVTHMFTSRVTSAYRMCTQFNMDWIIIFSVPQWIYIGSMIIAICIALGISFIITVGGVVVGVIYSVKITKPFENLIELFDHVSRMELDFLNIKPSRFKEVSKLQDQFLLMTQRIKQYRAFIPSHLLHQLENEDQGIEELNISTKKYSTNNNVLAVPSVSKRRSSLNSATGLDASMNSASSLKKGQSNILFKIGFEKRRISFMVIYLDGFNLWVQNLSFGEITHLLTDIYEVLQKVSLTNGAQVGNFENESVFLSWNSTERIKFHELKAAHTATTLRDRMNHMCSTKWDQKDIFTQSPKMLENFKIRFGICSQHSHCGNIGTKNSKSFTIIGSANNNLHFMMKKAKKFNLGIVVTHDTNVEITNDFHTRYVASTHLLNEDCTTSPLLDIRKPDKIRLYEVGESKSVEMDEWMYELQSTEQKNKWKMYNEACSRFFCNEFDEAVPLFREYLQQNPSDLPTLRMIEKCKKKK